MKVILQIAEIFFDGFQKLLEGDGMFENPWWSCEENQHLFIWKNSTIWFDNIVFIIVRQYLR